MYTFVVAYDLRRDQSDEHYDRVANAIRSCGVAIEAERSVWLLRSEATAKNIMPTIEAQLDRGDRILLAEIRRHWGHRDLMNGADALLPQD